MALWRSTYENPFDALKNLQSEIDRFWWDSTPFYSNRGLSGGNIFPPVNIFEKNQDELVVQAELPGIDQKDISISVKDDMLTIEGERRCYSDDDAKEVSFHRSERNSGSFSRSFRLPYKINPDKIEAKLTNGVLNLNMEKAAEAKTKQISIK